jgi:long-chain acyl-CoA synthetase
VLDAAVFVIPLPDLGEEVKAVVQPVAGVVADAALSGELLAFLGARVAKYKLPRSIHFVSELPRDPNGKLYKRKLRDPYWRNMLHHSKGHATMTQSHGQLPTSTRTGP